MFNEVKRAIDEQNEDFNKEIEYKKSTKQSKDLKNTVTEMKKSTERFSIGLDQMKKGHANSKTGQ